MSQTPASDWSSRPSFADAEVRYKRLMRDIATALHDVAPDLRWADKIENVGEASCTYLAPGGIEADSAGYLLVADSAVPEERWRTATDAVYDVVRDHGFVTRATVVDRPGQHEEVVEGPYGAVLRMMQAKTISLAIDGGCFAVPPRPPASSAPPPSPTTMPPVRPRPSHDRP